MAMEHQDSAQVMNEAKAVIQEHLQPSAWLMSAAPRPEVSGDVLWSSERLHASEISIPRDLSGLRSQLDELLQPHGFGPLQEIRRDMTGWYVVQTETEDHIRFELVFDTYAEVSIAKWAF